MRRHFAALALLCGATFFLDLGRTSITESDEAFYAEAAREMVERGDWLTPHFNYEYRFQKPVLYYWLAAAAYKVAGVSEAAARFPAAASGAALVLLTYLVARRYYHARVAFLAGAITATSFGYVSMARQGLPDLPLALFVTLATWGAAEALTIERRAAAASAPVQRDRWLFLSAAGVAGGLLMKGPVALLLPGLIVGCVLIVACRARPACVASRFRAPGPRAWTAAIMLVAVLALPWYGAMAAEHGPWYLQHFLIGENVERFATARYNDPRPIWYYVPVALGGLLPWTAFSLTTLPPALRVLARRRPLARHELVLMAWAVVPLLFYSASIGKQPRYILPILPPVAIATAAAISAAERNRDSARLRGVAAITAVIFGLVAAGIVRLTPFLETAGYGRGGLGALLVGGIAAISLAIAVFVPLTRIADALAVASAAVFVVLELVVLTPNRPEGVTHIAAALQTARAGGEQTATYRVFARNLIFYSRVRLVPLLDDEDAVAFLQSNDRVFCVLDRVDADRFASARQLRLRHLASATYFDPSRLRLGDLLDPDPDRIGTAVLVTNR